MKAFPVNYWDAYRRRVDEFSGLKNGLHANLAETSSVMAIDPKLVDLERAPPISRRFPDTDPHGPVHTAFFFTAPGSVIGRRNRHVGDARKSAADAGERYLEAGVRSTRAVLENIEGHVQAMPPRVTMLRFRLHAAHAPRAFLAASRSVLELVTGTGN